MPLYAALLNTANALRVFDKALDVTESNIANQNTPGYAKQRLISRAMPLDVMSGLTGGVEVLGMISARDLYAEAAVRRDNTAYGRYSQLQASVAQVEPYFEVSGTSGIPGALTKMFQAFSSWSMNPNDSSQRENVIQSASDVAQQINSLSSALSGAARQTDDQVRDTVSTINNLAASIRTLNGELRNAASRADPSVDALVQSTLEDLSQYVDLTVLPQQDGSITLLAGNQTPLVVGDHQDEIQYASTATQTTVLSAEGTEIADLLKGGKLGSLISFRNSTLAGYQANLDRLAASIADAVNTTLEGGVDLNGNAGADLFTYSADAPGHTLQVSGISTDELAAANTGAPGGNGNVLNLMALASAPAIDGLTMTGFYAKLASQVGRDLNVAKDAANTQQQLLMQARSMRQDTSGVSLDEEAALLLQFQRSYEACARVVTILDRLTEDTVNMLR